MDYLLNDKPLTGETIKRCVWISECVKSHTMLAAVKLLKTDSTYVQTFLLALVKKKGNNGNQMPPFISLLCHIFKNIYFISQTLREGKVLYGSCCCYLTKRTTSA